MTEPKRMSPSETPAVIPAIAIAAFPATEGVAETLRQAAGDRRMERARMDILPGGIEGAIERFRTVSTPNLIIVESSAELAPLLAQLALLAEECLPSTRVLVIGHRNDVTVYRELIGHGVSDYVVAPIGVVELCAVVGRIYADMAGTKLGATIAFMGASGGVGSSTIAHNVAWTMATEFDVDVVLVDADLAFGAASLNFNLETMHYGTADALASAGKIDEDLFERLLVRPHPRLSILPSPAKLDGSDQLIESALDGFDPSGMPPGFTLFDLPHSWSQRQLKFLRSIDQIVITARPDLSSLRNTKNLINYLKAERANDPPPKLVLNLTGVPHRPEIKQSDFVEAAESELEAVLSFDPQLFGTAANNGQMIGQVARNSKANRAFRQLAANLVNPRQTALPERKVGLAARLLGRKR